MTSDEKKNRLMGRVERYLFLRELDRVPDLLKETELEMITAASRELSPVELAEAFLEFPSFAARVRREREREPV